MSETSHVWESLQRAYAGNAWHGPGLRLLLGQVGARAAAAHPVPGARSIWEVASHLCLLEDRARRHLEGELFPEMTPEDRWPTAADGTSVSWAETLECFDCFHAALGNALTHFPDERLPDTVPGRDYPFYVLVHGLAQHELFHAGQLTVLMQAQGMAPVG